MELHSSGLFRTIGIDIFDTVVFRDVLDDTDQAFKVIGFQKVDDFLLEEFGQSGIGFSSQLGVLVHEALELDGEEMDEVLGPGVLDWDLNDTVVVSGDGGNTVQSDDFKAFS